MGDVSPQGGAGPLSRFVDKPPGDLRSQARLSVPNDPPKAK
jgi:hypothetical protein